MERLLGTSRQTIVLVLIGMLESSYAEELSRLSGASRTAVDKLLDRLEDDGILVSVREGRNRRVSINPRYKARQELIELLKKIGRESPQIMSALATLRRRPRRKGKKLWPQT